MPSSPTKGAKGGKKRQFCLAGMKILRIKVLTFVLSSLLCTATVLEGLFGAFSNFLAHFLASKLFMVKTPFCAPYMMEFIGA